MQEMWLMEVEGSVVAGRVEKLARRRLDKLGEREGDRARRPGVKSWELQWVVRKVWRSDRMAEGSASEVGLIPASTSMWFMVTECA